MTTLRLGTRRSTLALAQAHEVADRLGALGHDVDLVPLSTLGDQSSHALTTIGGTGVFAAAIRRALLDGEIDLAVHSLKDLPTAPEPGLVVAATPTREDPRDVLVARDGLTLGELPAGSVVGTASPRRAAQLGALGLGLDVVPVRGNVDTRLDLVRTGAVDAVVLARAGLVRIGRVTEATETIDPLQMLPAPGQGALAVECREDRADVRAAIAALDDAFVGTPDGSAELRRSVVAPVADPVAAGHRLAALLLEDGAAGLALAKSPPAAASRSPGPAELPDGIPRPISTFTTNHQHHTEQVS